MPPERITRFDRTPRRIAVEPPPIIVNTETIHLERTEVCGTITIRKDTTGKVAKVDGPLVTDRRPIFPRGG